MDGITLSFTDARPVLAPGALEEQVRAAARRAVSVLGENGGYIMCTAHYMQNDTPIENVEALYDVSNR